MIVIIGSKMRTVFSALLILLASSALTSPRNVQALIKCWVNNEGIKECGNAVPPQYVQKGYQEISEGNWVSNRKERIKTEEEMEEKDRLARLEAERKEREEKQKTMDDALLKTFSSVNDIERVRDDRVLALEGTIKLTQERNKKLQSDLDDYTERAAELEREGKLPPENFLNNIKSLKQQMKKNNDFITQKRQEQQNIKETLTASIKRFKELKGIQ